MSKTNGNGTSFHTFLTESIHYLDGKTVAGYYAEPLPSEMDGRMGQLVARLVGATAEEREQFSTTLTQQQRSLFGIYGHRAATLAARNESGEQLLMGLVATAVSNFTIPERRRVEVGLAVFHHVAHKLEMNPIELFEETAVYATDEFAQILLSFSRRADITLKKYGWEEQKTDDGVKYKFGWRA